MSKTEQALRIAKEALEEHHLFAQLEEDGAAYCESDVPTPTQNHDSVCTSIASDTQNTGFVSMTTPDSALKIAIKPKHKKALQRFHETCLDGEGYDVPKEVMSELSHIGFVRRTSGAHYEITDCGLAALAAPMDAQPIPHEFEISPNVDLVELRKSVSNGYTPTSATILDMIDRILQSAPRPAQPVAGAPDEQERFEHHMLSCPQIRTRWGNLDVYRQPSGDYLNGIMFASWSAWQAALSASNQVSAAQPVEPVQAGWLPIESAPKDKRVLVWSGQEIYAAHWAKNPYTYDEAWIVAEWGNDRDQALVKPTHWTELPPIPAQTKGGGK